MEWSDRMNFEMPIHEEMIPVQRQIVSTVLDVFLSLRDLPNFESNLSSATECVFEIIHGRATNTPVRIKLREILVKAGYSYHDPESESIYNVISFDRLNVTIDLAVALVHGYMRWNQSQHEWTLKIYPSKELYHATDRHEYTDWKKAWKKAGGLTRDGRMIASKSSPIWHSISHFGLPFDPFDVESGFRTKDIDLNESRNLGITLHDNSPLLNLDFRRKLEARLDSFLPVYRPE